MGLAVGNYLQSNAVIISSYSSDTQLWYAWGFSGAALSVYSADAGPQHAEMSPSESVSGKKNPTFL